MQNEGRRIFHRPELKVTCTCVRVPVMRSHSISVTVKTERRIELDEARAAIAAYPACALSTIIRDAITRRRLTPAIRNSSGSAECAATSWMRMR